MQLGEVGSKEIEFIAKSSIEIIFTEIEFKAEVVFGSNQDSFESN